MRDIDILHDLLKKQCSQIHPKRLNSLMVATESLLDSNQLSLTQLGRNITSKVALKHNIKWAGEVTRTFKLENICGLISLRDTGELLSIDEWEDAGRGVYHSINS